MGRSRSAADLRKIAQIRDLQREGAERNAAGAAAAARSLERGRDLAAHQLAETERDWQQAAVGPSFQIEIAAAWSHEIVEREGRLAEATDQLTEGRRHEAATGTEWAHAIVRSDLASKAAGDAVRALRRRREENRTAEAADRAGQRGRRP